MGTTFVYKQPCFSQLYLIHCHLGNIIICDQPPPLCLRESLKVEQFEGHAQYQIMIHAGGAFHAHSSYPIGLEKVKNKLHAR